MKKITLFDAALLVQKTGYRRITLNEVLNSYGFKFETRYYNSGKMVILSYPLLNKLKNRKRSCNVLFAHT